MYVTSVNVHLNPGRFGGVGSAGGKRVGGWVNAVLHTTSLQTAGPQNPSVYNTSVSSTIQNQAAMNNYHRMVVGNDAHTNIEVIDIFDNIIEMSLWRCEDCLS